MLGRFQDRSRDGGTRRGKGRSDTREISRDEKEKVECKLDPYTGGIKWMIVEFEEAEENARTTHGYEERNENEKQNGCDSDGASVQYELTTGYSGHQKSFHEESKAGDEEVMRKFMLDDETTTSLFGNVDTVVNVRMKKN